jgi:hypothetical protein
MTDFRPARINVTSPARAMVAKLSAMSDDDVAALMLRATYVRLDLETDGGMNLLQPSKVMPKDPLWCSKASILIDHYKQEGDFGRANGLMIWLLTVRSASDSSLQDTGPAIWAGAFSFL